MLDRRHFLKGAAVAAMLAPTGPRIAEAANSVNRVPLRANDANLASFAPRISSFAIERFGRRAQNAWLLGPDGALHVGVGQFDVQPYFEVFPLSIMSRSEFERRAAQPMRLPPEMPERMRQLFESVPRYQSPWPPAEQRQWPFRDGTIEVVERAEFVVPIGEAPDPTFGRPMNQQSWARPGEVPAEATAVAEVGVGLLFTSAAGERLLLASGDMPLELLVAEGNREVDSYLETCRLVPLSEYRTGTD